MIDNPLFSARLLLVLGLLEALLVTETDCEVAMGGLLDCCNRLGLLPDSRDDLLDEMVDARDIVLPVLPCLSSSLTSVGDVGDETSSKSLDVSLAPPFFGITNG